MSDGAHNLDPRLLPEQGQPARSASHRAKGQKGSGESRPGVGPLQLERRAVARGRHDDAPAKPGETRPQEPADLERELMSAAEQMKESGGAGDGSGEVSGLGRHRGVGRRLSDSLRSAEEGELTKEQFLFLMAIEGFKRENNAPFPAWTDVLEVVRLLGYRKTMPSELTLRNAEDWTEKPDGASNVRPKGFHRRLAA